MTTSSRKSYNENALRGGDIDDMEVVEEFGLDPTLAYTPAINDAMLELVYTQNIDAGVSQDDAMKYRRHAAAKIKKLMK